MGKEVFVGDEANCKRGILNLSRPIERGVVINWDDMEKVWHHMFYNELRVLPEEHAVLLSEAPFNPKANRQLMTKIMFETFRAPAIFVCAQSVLSLYCSGRTTGCVVDSGHGVSCIVPIYEGFVCADAIIDAGVTGGDVTELLERLSTERGYTYTTAADREILLSCKERLTYVALDFEREMTIAAGSSDLDRDYEGPDGERITFGDERFRAPEALFQPALLGRDGVGVHRCTYDSIMRCDPGIRQQMFDSIVLAGGNTMFPGLADRLAKELTALAPWARVRVIAPPERRYSTWIGGSLLAQDWSALAGNGISRKRPMTLADYEALGPSGVHSICFGAVGLQLFEVLITVMLARERGVATTDAAASDDARTPLAASLASLPSRPLEMIAEAIAAIGSAEVAPSCSCQSQ
jgi:actin-related protein